MTIYVPPPVPLQAPALAPLQPRQFFTPGLALGIPRPRTWAQQAAYQRDRVDIAHLLQRMQPIARMTAAQPLGIPGPRTMDQAAALRREMVVPGQPPVQSVPSVAAGVPYLPPLLPARVRLDEPAVLEEPLPLFTAGLALGVPVPCVWAQQAAYQRDRVELVPLINPVPVATAALPLAAPIAYVWAQQAAYQQPRFHDRPMAIEIGETVVDFTAGFALGAPPPLPFDQFAALRRDAAQPLQLWPQILPPLPTGVPFLAQPAPPRSRGDDPAVLDEVLPAFTPIPPPSVPPMRATDQAAAYWRLTPQPLQFAIYVSAPPPGVTYAGVQTPPRGRTDDLAALDEALPGLFAPAPPSFVPGMRLQMPQLSFDQWQILSLPLRAQTAPLPPIEFYRGEKIALAIDDRRILIPPFKRNS